MNLGSGGCSEPRSHHYTLAWATEQNSISKNNNKKKKEEEEERNRRHEARRRMKPWSPQAALSPKKGQTSLPPCIQPKPFSFLTVLEMKKWEMGSLGEKKTETKMQR